ncbi:MAG TPA: phage tail terminator-like protein [Trueperaceae bacterium]|nr:phage tail terminator-like protein [Trueperaceae bacterium]
MTATPEQAENEILDAFKARWDADGPDAAGLLTAPRVEYDNVVKLAPPASGSECWVRATVQHNGEGGHTLGEPGTRLWTSTGIVMIQVFVPQDEGKVRALRLCKVARDAFQGAATPSGVWFRNVRIVHVGRSDPWYQMNVVAEFQYDERR